MLVVAAAAAASGLIGFFQLPATETACAALTQDGFIAGDVC